MVKPMRTALTVENWGNSLAVRLPADTAKQLGIREGDTLIVELSPDGRLILAAEGRLVGRAEARRLREFLSHQEETAPITGDMRERGRY
jgi:antitoxin MazE